MFLEAANIKAAGEEVMEDGRALVARWEMAKLLSEWISGISEVGDSRDCIAAMASTSAGLTESTFWEWMSGMLTTIMGRACQSWLEDVNTNPAEEVVTRLLLAVVRRKTEDRGFIVCLKAPSEY